MRGRGGTTSKRGRNAAPTPLATASNRGTKRPWNNEGWGQSNDPDAKRPHPSCPPAKAPPNPTPFDYAATQLSFEEMQRRWGRPNVPPQTIHALDAQTAPFMFQILQTKASYVRPKDIPIVNGPLQSKGYGAVPVVRLYGVTPEGYSVCVHAWNFHPYFYARTPDNKPHDQIDFEQLAEDLDNLIAREKNYTPRAGADGQGQGYDYAGEELPPRQFVESVEPHMAFDCDGYREDMTPLIKINLRTPNLVSLLRNMIGVDPVKHPGISTAQGTIAGPCYECNVVYEDRFNIDHEILGTGWVRVRPDLSRQRRRWEYECETECQLEIDVDHRHILGVSEDAEAAVYDTHKSRLRIMHRDDEMMPTVGFPKPERDPIIVLCAQVTEVSSLTDMLAQVCFCLGSLPESMVADPDGTAGTLRAKNRIKYMCFASEDDLLRAYAAFIKAVDVDIWSGYNVKNFDCPYEFDRAQVLGVQEFMLCSRLRGKVLEKREHNTNNKAQGARESWLILNEGRVQIDVFQWFQNNKKMRSYKLNAVSAEILGDQKDDVSHKMIAPLHKGSPQDRARLCHYCQKDVTLSRELMIRTMLMDQTMALVRTECMQLQDEMDGSATLKSFIFDLMQARLANQVIPFRPDAEKLEYPGATVFEPVRGLYDRPIDTLDFASLYPSCIRAHNLSDDTHIEPKYLAHWIQRLGIFNIERCPDGFYYVKEHVRKGKFPRIVERLMNRRAAIKLDIKIEAAKEKPNKDRLRELGLRELAVKLRANSFYGYTAVPNHGRYAFYVGRSTTAWGREQIRITRFIIESEFTVAKGFKFDARVLYGDSVTGDMPILVRDWTGRVRVTPIDVLVNWHMPRGEPGDAKQRLLLDEGRYDVWSDKGWTPIRALIRHRTMKRIYRISTTSGVVCVTEDHSLLRPDGSVCKPTEVAVGETLMHARLGAPAMYHMNEEVQEQEDEGRGWVAGQTCSGGAIAHVNLPVLLRSRAYRQAFWDGMCANKCRSAEFQSELGVVEQTGIGAQSVCLLLTSLGRRYTVTPRGDDRVEIIAHGPVDEERGPEERWQRIQSIEDVTHFYHARRYQYTPEHGCLVYDLETENHHFSAGVGEIVVHNTDSVMVDFGLVITDWNDKAQVAAAYNEAKALGVQAAKLCTESFAPPNQLAFECITMPFLLMNKKRYTGLMWIAPDKYDPKPKTKGIESVRRDNCPLVPRTMKRALDMILKEHRPKDAIQYAAEQIGRLRRGEVDMHDLIISAQLSKTEYKNPQAHVQVMELMKARSPGSEPLLGDRVPYVITAADKQTKRFQKAENPLYALEQGVTLDMDYYVDNQMLKPLLRMFKPIFGEDKARRMLLQFNDVRIVRLGNVQKGLTRFLEPAAGSGPKVTELSAAAAKPAVKSFFHRLESCRRCGVTIPLNKAKTAAALTAEKADPERKQLLCAQCEPHRIELLTETLSKLRISEMQYNRVWTHCQHCQGSFTQEVICEADDCVLFYKRTALKKDLERTRQDYLAMQDW